MSLEIKKYPNGYAVCVSPSEHNPYNSLSDYDEFLGNAFTFTNLAVRKYSSGYFDSQNNFAQSISDYFYEYREKIGYHLRFKWEQAKRLISGTHTFNEDGLTYWDDNANKIYKEHWKPVITEHLNYLKDCNDDDFSEFVENLDSALTLGNFPFVAKLLLPNPYYVDEQRKKWIDHLTAKLAEFESGINLTKLDEVIDFYMYGDNHVENWLKFSMIPDADYWTRYEKTIKDYLFGSPFITPVSIQHHYHLNICPISIDDDLGNIEGFMFIDSHQLENNLKDAVKNFLQYADEFLSGDFYDVDLIFIVPEGKQHLYPECELSKDIGGYIVRDLNNPSVLCLGQNAALEYFDYIEKEPPYHPTYNYTVLGQVKHK